MMPSFQLSTGCCAQLPLTSYEDDTSWKEPVVQFLSVIKVVTRNGERYRLIISDGIHFIQAILATSCNRLVETENIQNFTVAIIEKWTSNTVQDRRLVILLSVRILGNPNEKIGEPVSLDDIVDGAAIEHAHVATSSALTATSSQQHCARVGNQRGAEDIQRSPPILLIDDLNPYQNNWTIKAQVTQKTDIKTWSKDKSDGKLFSVTLMDESGEIRATAFNIAADELFTRLEEGKVYYISRARVKLANKKFSKNDYELTLDLSTEVQECHDTSAYPQLRSRFIPFSQLVNLEKDTLCDVIGILREVGDLAEVMTRQESHLVKKLELILVDDTGCSVQMTLWGKFAEAFDVTQGSVVAFKNVRITDFGGVSLSTIYFSQLEVNPQAEDHKRLRHWYDTEGIGLTFESKTIATGGYGSRAMFNRAEALSLKQIKDSGLGTGEKADFFSAQGTIVHIRGENVYYPACTGPNCLKKMSQDEDSWHCGKCGTRAQAPNYRYIMTMTIADWSDKMWLTGFDEAGLVIFGRTATQLHDVKMKDEVEYNDIIQDAMCCRFSFACRAKKETYDNRVRVRYEITRVDQINYHEEASYTLELLRSPQWH